MFKLQSLNEFLCQTLAATEDVKYILKSDCDEAAFCLKPWSVETMIKKEVGEDNCTCSDTSELEAEEVSAGIRRALLQAQQLREKLSLNLRKGKKSSRTFITSHIYTSESASKSKSFKPEVRKDIKSSKTMRVDKKEKKEAESQSPNSHVNKSHNYGKRPTSIESSKNAVSKSKSSTKQHNVNLPHTQKSVEKLKVGNQKPTSFSSNSHKHDDKAQVANKPLIKGGAKSTKGKDFLAINKMSAKNTKHINRHNSVEKVTESDRKIYSAASTSELKSLIEKMSLESDKCTLDMNKNNCPLHGNVSPQYIYEQSVATMDVIESLDTFNVPGQIITVLKIYHEYLKSEYSQELSVDTQKRRKMANNFLTEFNEMENMKQAQLTEESELISLSKSYISLLENVFSKNEGSATFDDIKTKHEDLNNLWRAYESKPPGRTRITKLDIKRKQNADIPNTIGWMANGIWNTSSIKNFEGMSRTYCARYLSKDQLLSFFEMEQQLQQIQYLKALIDIILKEVIPGVKEYFDPSKLEFIKAYKMICILLQGLNPRLPILVRTDT